MIATHGDGLSTETPQRRPRSAGPSHGDVFLPGHCSAGKRGGWTCNSTAVKVESFLHSVCVCVCVCVLARLRLCGWALCVRLCWSSVCVCVVRKDIFDAPPRGNLLCVTLQGLCCSSDISVAFSIDLRGDTKKRTAHPV